MLVLTRSVGETIHISGDIVIKVIENRGKDGVRLGIEAPRGVKIHRGEIVDAVARANRGAAKEGHAEDLLRALVAAREEKPAQDS